MFESPHQLQTLENRHFFAVHAVGKGSVFHVIISTNKNAGGNTEQEAEKKIFCVIYST